MGSLDDYGIVVDLLVAEAVARGFPRSEAEIEVCSWLAHGGEHAVAVRSLLARLALGATKPQEDR